MKKIVALVLSLVMVLGLATTAFAAADEYDMYLADDTMATNMKLENPLATVVIDEFAAKTNKDGSGNVAYLFIAYAEAPDQGAYYVKTTAPTIESYAVCAEGKTDVLFYVDAVGFDAGVFSYTASVTAFTSFSGYDKCGCLTVTPDADDVYFQTAAGVVYKALDAANGVVANNYLLNGEVVSVDTAVGALAPVDHYFVANNYTYDSVKKVNVPTSALCTKCMMTSTAIYLDGKAPAGSTVKELNSDKAYEVVPGAAASAPAAGEKVESAQTFDAGIAMYVGMSVMAAAGSAVVLKKKD